MYLFICVFIYVAINSIQPEEINKFNDNKKCFIKMFNTVDEINETYALVFEETFWNNELLLERKVVRENVKDNCDEKSICNFQDNLSVIDDLLILYLESTSDKQIDTEIKNLEQISYNDIYNRIDRYELRVAIPIGIRVCLSANVDQTFYESCFVLSNDQNVVNQTVQIVPDQNDENKNASYLNYSWKILDSRQFNYRFHLTGIHFFGEILHFFLDDFYTEPLTEIPYLSLANITIKIDLDPFSNDHAITKSPTCPALLIDHYRRYFTKNDENEIPKNCPKISSNKFDEFLIKDTCSLLSDFNNKKIRNTEKSSQIGCFMMNSWSDDVWKLTWEDSFEDRLNSANWLIDGENTCDENKAQYCTLSHNVEVENGYLAMHVRAEKYEKFNYTGARITSRQFFPQGRIEIRAAFPNDGYLRVCVRTVDSKSERPDRGEIYIVCYSPKSSDSFTSGLYVNDIEKSMKHLVAHQKHSSSVEGDYSFYIHGIEWTDQELRYFYDDKYSQIFKLKTPQFQKKFRQIQIEIGIIGSGEPLFSNQSWDCPVLLVDYVRVYEKVSQQYLENQQTHEGSKCRLIKMRSGESYSACREARETFFEYSKDQELDRSFWGRYSYTILIFVLFVLLISFVTSIICLLKRFKKVDQQFPSNQNDENNIYESVEDFIFFRQNSSSYQIKPKYYLELSEKYQTLLDEYVPFSGEDERYVLQRTKSVDELNKIYYQLYNGKKVHAFDRNVNFYVSMKRSKSSSVLV